MCHDVPGSDRISLADTDALQMRVQYPHVVGTPKNQDGRPRGAGSTRLIRHRIEMHRIDHSVERCEDGRIPPNPILVLSPIA
jgi:hypothetical protein